jgi:hypothetical protein
MKNPTLAGLAALSLTLVVSGCISSPSPAPLAPSTVTKTIAAPTAADQPFDAHDIFRPDQSSCQEDLTVFVTDKQMSQLIGKRSNLRLVDNLNMCIRSIVEEIARHPQQVDVTADGSSMTFDDYKTSPCRTDLTNLDRDPAEDRRKLGRCFDAVISWQQNVMTDSPVVYDR